MTSDEAGAWLTEGQLQPASTLLLRELEAIAAHGGARSACALRLAGAPRRAAVVGSEVAVVALLETLDDPVAAPRGMAHSRPPTFRTRRDSLPLRTAK